jgi:hypothetical protein
MSPNSLLVDFFSTSDSKNLKEKELLRNIITMLPADSPMLYDLTFHAAFVKRIFDVIRREGRLTQGFDRMQQSFTDSVEKVRAILLRFESEYHIPTDDLTSPTPEARAKLSRFIEDLAQLKNWLVSHESM